MIEKSVRILIVEDEFITLDNLRDALEELGYLVVGAVMKAEQAIPILEAGGVDLAILDIHLGKGNSGIWLGGQIQSIFHLPFIFLTAFEDKETIAAAAKTHPSSYLVKPFVMADLHAAIELALHTYADSGIVPPPRTADSPGLLINDSIFVKDKLIYRRIPVSDISYVQTFRNYLEIVSGGKKYVLRSPLKDFLETLPPDMFFQTHRSYVVNLSMVDRMGGNFVGLGEHEVPLSRNVRQEVLARLNMFG